MSPSPAAELRTERLLLRPWRRADAPLFLEAVEASLEHLRPWMPWARAEPSPPDELERRLAGFGTAFAEGREWLYGIFAPDASHLLGGCGLHPRRGPGVLEIGYWIHAHHTRRGLATEAALALTRAAFEIGIERVEIRCDARNTQSSGVPRRLGFELAETIRDDPDAPGSAPRHTLVFRLERSEHERRTALHPRRASS